jgi:hypothetical protein
MFDMLVAENLVDLIEEEGLRGAFHGSEPLD